MGKRRILFIVHNHPILRPGGAEGYALELFRALRHHDHFEPIFVARADAADGSGRAARGTPFSAVGDDPNEYFVHTNNRGFDFFTLTSKDPSLHTRHFRDFLLAVQPDVVHIQHTLFIGNELLTTVRQTLPEVPIVYTLHEFLAICNRNGQMLRTNGENCLEASPRRCHECFPDISEQQFFLRQTLTRSHFDHVDLFLAPSRFLRDRYVDWGIPENRIRFEDYGRLPQRVREPASEDRPRTRFGFFGQFTPYKGVTVALEAMGLLGETDAHLWVHGANLEIQPEAFRSQFNDLLELSGDNVTLMGRYEQRDLPELMAQVDWVIVPSIWWENSPLVIQEAFIHGKPIICSDIGGMAEKVDHGVNGLHFRAGDPRSLAEAIQRAAGEEGLWDTLSRGVPEIYPMDDHVESMVEIYDELLGATVGAV